MDRSDCCDSNAATPGDELNLAIQEIDALLKPGRTSAYYYQ
jgi:hypothetical protein